MKYAHSLSLLVAVLIAGCSTDEDRMRARLEALPELPADIAEQLDSTTMASRHPDLGMLPEIAPIADPKLLPCCSLKVTKRLRVLYQTTWCVNPIDTLVLDPKPDRNAQGNAGNAKGVRHNKLSSLRGKKFVRPFWCQTTDGPWDAELVNDHPCSGQPYFRLLVSTPGGLIALPTWEGGEANKPASVTVLQCNLVGTQRLNCGGLSTCQCRSSMCTPPEPCGCDVF